MPGQSRASTVVSWTAAIIMTSYLGHMVYIDVTEVRPAAAEFAEARKEGDLQKMFAANKKTSRAVQCARDPLCWTLR